MTETVLKMSVVAAAAISCSARSACCGEDPFARHDPPPERAQLSNENLGEFLYTQVQAYAEAERLFAAGDYLGAVFEYECAPYGHEARDFGLMADIVEHDLTALMEVVLANLALRHANRLVYTDGAVRFLLIHRSTGNTTPITLIESDGSKRNQIVKKDSDPISWIPDEWKDNFKAIDDFDEPRKELERSFERFGMRSILTYRFPYRVETVVRANHVRERWRSAQGWSKEQILGEYRKDSIESPLVEASTRENPFSYPIPTINLVMFADYCTRHPEKRDEFLGAVSDLLTSGRIGLEDIRRVNSLVPIRITTAELAEHVLKAPRRSPEKKAKAAEILGEINRYREKHGIPPIVAQDGRFLAVCVVLAAAVLGGTVVAAIIYRKIRGRWRLES